MEERIAQIDDINFDKIYDIEEFATKQIESFDDVDATAESFVNSQNVSSCENSVENLLFSTKKAVFYFPHQDDETLYYSQAITAAVDILGKENVYVVLVTDGNASAVKNNAFVKKIVLR